MLPALRARVAAPQSPTETKLVYRKDFSKYFIPKFLTSGDPSLKSLTEVSGNESPKEIIISAKISQIGV